MSVIFILIKEDAGVAVLLMKCLSIRAAVWSSYFHRRNDQICALPHLTPAVLSRGKVAQVEGNMNKVNRAHGKYL